MAPTSKDEPEPAPPPGEWRTLEPLLPLARALHEEIDRRLAGAADTGLLDVDGMIGDALHTLGVAHATAALRTLSPAAFLELYARHVGDDGFADLLRARADQERRTLERERRLERIASEAAASSLLRLQLLEAGDAIHVGLFQGLAGEAHRESRVPPDRTLAFRVLDPATGHAELLHDRALARPGASPVRLPEHTRGLLGTLVHDAGAARLEPTLSTHGRLSFTTPDRGAETLPGIVGFVETADGRLLLDGA
jgi:hypothetical protein